MFLQCILYEGKYVVCQSHIHIHIHAHTHTHIHTHTHTHIYIYIKGLSHELECYTGYIRPS